MAAMKSSLSIFDATESQRAKKTFYPTPEYLAERLLAGIDLKYVGAVLEPSAGKGDLAFAVAKALYKAHFRSYERYHGEGNELLRKAIQNADIDCVEIDPVLRNVLEKNMLRVVHDDFLTFETQKRYDLIVMNPPFDEGAKHLLKALSMVEGRGGMIRCILNAETLRNLYSTARINLDKKLKLHKAKIEYVRDAFLSAERRTDVEIALVSIDIPRPQIDSTIMEDMRKAPTYKTQTIPSEYAELVRYNEIEEWVNRHNFEVACGIRMIEEYYAIQPHALSKCLILNFHATGERDTKDVMVNAYIQEVRHQYWSALFESDVIRSRLTSNLVNDLRDMVTELRDYEFSVYNILTLIVKMNARVVNGIEATILKLFDDWTGRFHWSETTKNRHYYDGWRTNDCFRVGKKVIIPLYAYDEWRGEYMFRSYKVRDALRDIEKVFDFLDNGRTHWDGTLDAALKYADEMGAARNIDTKYFTMTLYKKGTAHLVFKDEALLEKFNLFASQKKGWLPPEYGRKRYADMNEEERHVVDSFQGREKYEQVMARADFYLNTGAQNQFLLSAGEET